MLGVLREKVRSLVFGEDGVARAAAGEVAYSVLL